MKKGLNKTELIGNVGREDAVLGTIPGSNTSVLNFSFAVNDSYRDRNGEEHQSTDWFKVAIFGERAVTLAPYITGGKPLYLEGKIDAKAWQPKNEDQSPKGDPKASLVLRVKELLFLDGSRQTEDLSGAVDGEAFGDDEVDNIFPV